MSLYDEFTDNFVRISGERLKTVCNKFTGFTIDDEKKKAGSDIDGLFDKDGKTALKYKNVDEVENWLLIRPCIEHYMLAAIIGRGGLQHLGATLW